VWLRKRKDGLGDFHPVRTATSLRMFDGSTIENKSDMDPAVTEALCYIKSLMNSPQGAEYDAYEIIVWTPQRYSSGPIGQIEPRDNAGRTPGGGWDLTDDEVAEVMRTSFG
jgi:hypothetical protein